MKKFITTACALAATVAVASFAVPGSEAAEGCCADCTLNTDDCGCPTGPCACGVACCDAPCCKGTDAS